MGNFEVVKCDGVNDQPHNAPVLIERGNAINLWNARQRNEERENIKQDSQTELKFCQWPK